jgi:predicted restriction endonuclease
MDDTFLKIKKRLLLHRAKFCLLEYNYTLNNLLIDTIPRTQLQEEEKSVQVHLIQTRIEQSCK